MTAHALKLRDSYPEAFNALIDDTYMDDTNGSQPNKVECVKLVALSYLTLRQIYITGATYQSNQNLFPLSPRWVKISWSVFTCID
jgi:hypothetical protein